jgi:hypothetical protein
MGIRLARGIRAFAMFVYDYAASSLSDGFTSSHVSYFLMRRLYSLSRGKSSQVLACLPRLLHPSKSRPSTSSSFAVQSLKTHGFHKTNYPSSLVQSLCERLRIELSAYPVYEVLHNFSTGSEYPSIHLALADPSRNSVRLNHHRKDVSSSLCAWEIIKELQMIDIADLYLGCDPILTSIDSWYVVPIKENGDSVAIYSAAAQTFHYDMDWIKFVKFFVNLTDVDEAHGPFEFISNSHKIKSKSCYKDGRFESLLDQSGLIKATGPTGSVFVADTSGIHRDGRAISGFRQVLQVEFAVSSFGAKFQYDNIYQECSHSVPWGNLPAEMTRRKRMLRLFCGS